MSTIMHDGTNLVQDDLSEAWLAWSRSERRPANTVRRRAATLKSIGNAGTATREDVEAWWLRRAYLAPASRHSDLANLHSFYKWCRRWEYRDDDPTLRIDAPHVDPGLPRPMTREDLHTALDALSGDLRRAVCLGAYAGLRVSEAAALDWSNVDLEARQIRVMHSKGGKSRLVPIGPILLDALLPRTGGNVVTGGGGGPLLTSGIPYSASRLAKRVSSAFRRLGIDATFHQLRHRYGTIAYKATGDVLAVSRLMGHANINTTAVYAAANDEVAAKIALAVSA
jgi:integrase